MATIKIVIDKIQRVPLESQGIYYQHYRKFIIKQVIKYTIDFNDEFVKYIEELKKGNGEVKL